MSERDSGRWNAKPSLMVRTGMWVERRYEWVAKRFFRRPLRWHLQFWPVLALLFVLLYTFGWVVFGGVGA